MKFLLSLALIILSQAYAKATDTPKVSTGVINVRQFEESSKKVKSYKDAINKKKEKYQNELKRMGEEINADSSALQSKISALSAAQKKVEEGKIQSRIEQATKYAQRAKAIIELAESYSGEDLNKCIMRDVEKVSKSSGMDVVLNSNSVLFISDNIPDITEKVVKEFDNSSCKLDIDNNFAKAKKDVENAEKNNK
ncbi:OmpH/Skp family outer membrane protein [Candidatus Deianiraea vastatrix]|uniref:Skp family periplasmic chaperone n=1 Tax=Candidatus Deianiraea vastatrix TaxID=2163644 RepID=A0A5B8XC26_9RICK|nr:OmpH family outer membrane protein [Candidatus Deianiraea vastatrix]QED22820.1 Skp family periplasmic chaperone [Candidatus Deianiraea vastatrix]